MGVLSFLLFLLFLFILLPPPLLFFLFGIVSTEVSLDFFSLRFKKTKQQQKNLCVHIECSCPMTPEVGTGSAGTRYRQVWATLPGCSETICIRHSQRLVQCLQFQVLTLLNLASLSLVRLENWSTDRNEKVGVEYGWGKILELSEVKIFTHHLDIVWEEEFVKMKTRTDKEERLNVISKFPV